MESEPCARVTKSMMPNTSATPAASRNSRRPNCNPFRNCSTTSSMEALGHFGLGLLSIMHPAGPQWFETRGVAALLTMRVLEDLILRSIARRCVSRDEATDLAVRPQDMCRQEY